MVFYNTSFAMQTEHLMLTNNKGYYFNSTPPGFIPGERFNNRIASY
ncbi:hypothetical protein SEE_03817 [Salmonella enterica subsp. enterica serovar Typhimurium str. TN061786]|nr:hypothetical protein DC51_4302 [Salmonella enterica subsp. enterica serovar Typhimurium]EFX48135.1 hypothetical protein SEE_03817 [Salmonella enterica subsp. enterica serovar Typhimurium str. TN061786]